ncbi:MAG: T9SS type A sorting domain-containing protein, partial [Saprospiraceae bacterium]|nr:T9SS type A sorting domain-containing protein [Saprospiraceae bacterium]
ILGVIVDLPTNESWRFVDSDQIMAMDMDLADVDYTANIDNIQGNSMDNDLVAVKVGDVTENAIGNLTNGSIAEVRSNKTLTLSIENRDVEVGEKVSVEFMSDDFADVFGYQFTMEMNGLEFVGVQNGAIEIGEANVGVLTREVMTMSYNSTTAVSATEAEAIFTLEFIATESGNLGEMLDITSKVTRSEAYVGSDYEIRDVVIETRGGSLEGAVTTLYQNEPNPFKGQTTIGFTLAERGSATMTVFDVTGKLLANKTIDGVKGYNTVNFTAEQLGVSGVLYYTLESGDFTATKKMIIIE